MTLSTSENSETRCTPWETPHKDVIHDCQSDYYSLFLATCSSDSTVCIRTLKSSSSSSPQQSVQQLFGHEGPVWSISWSPPGHPLFLASGGYDGFLILWVFQTDQSFKLFHKTKVSHTSVNKIAWASGYADPRIACVSSDGNVHVFHMNFEENPPQTKSTLVGRHTDASLCVSWVLREESQNKNEFPFLFSGGADGKIKLWEEKEEIWVLCREICIGKWVRDISARQNVGASQSMVAVASCDGYVRIFTLVPKKKLSANSEGSALQTFDEVQQLKMKDNPLSLSWNRHSTVLAVATSGRKIVLFRSDIGTKDEKLQETYEESISSSKWREIKAIELVPTQV